MLRDPRPTMTTEKSIRERLLQAHRLLHARLEELETMASPPEEREPQMWYAYLTKFQHTLLQHFQMEEEGGYMSEVLERTPNQKRRVERLLEEHRTFAATLQAFLDELTTDPELIHDFYVRMKTWLAQIHEHETCENLLVEDTFNQDEAAED